MLPNFGAAAADAVACRRVAAAVEVAAEVRATAAKAAQDGWSGPARDEFDLDLRRVQREAADLAADLRHRAAAIEAGLWEPHPLAGAR